MTPLGSVGRQPWSAEPPLWLMTVVENLRRRRFLSRVVPALAEPLEKSPRPRIQAKWLPLLKPPRLADKVRAKAADGNVTHVDLTDAVIDVAGKFVTYALFPKAPTR